MDLPKLYSPQEVEDKIYQKWEKSGYFNPDKLNLPENAPVFSIMMPPPNVTGVLHLGHALENTIMDAEIRYQRMRGKRAMLLPGTDHAAVATQARVEKDLINAGKYKNPRQELGREKFLEIIREYAENSKATILKQIRKMGTSCDWSRLAYTFDEQRERAVNEMFVKMYNDGLIYRGYRVVNWSVKGQSTLSDDEVVHQEQKGKLYTFKYSKDFPIPIATTRPETKLGDTAVAVNPNDPRYEKYIGAMFGVEVGAKKPLKIKIIADKAVDANFGTGALGVTPAHSQIDFELKEKHGLELVAVIDQYGRMTEEAGSDYAGLKVLEAREKFVNYLKEKGLLIKEEEIIQNVGTSDRFGDTVEVIPMMQWFVNVNKKISGRNKSLKDLMKEVFTTGLNGDPKQKIKITPERFEKSYFNWIDNLRDWCISRQIWWGHQIPVWYKKQKTPTQSPPCQGGDKEGVDSKIWDLKIYGEDMFQNLVEDEKTIEIRAGKPKGAEKYWGDFKTGDVIEFYLADENTDKFIESAGSEIRMVKKVKHFDSFDKLFKEYQGENDYPGKTNNEVRAWYEARPVLNERVKKYGLWVFELERPTNNEATKQENNEPEAYAGIEPPKGADWERDPDTLDTWFSSGLWTFSTLGWPEQTDDLKKFHPTSWMQMGYEILFFWMARMILMSAYALDELPFREVCIHGILRDISGKKFSKSAGNGIDPLDMCTKYGTDALRMSLISGVAPGNDAKFYEDKVVGFRNFANKLWNIGRFIQMQGKTQNSISQEQGYEIKTLTDKWIISRLNSIIKEVTKDFENYGFSLAAEKLCEFAWHELADWYLEIAKKQGDENTYRLLTGIYLDVLKLLHPFMPFITEVIFESFEPKKMLMVEKWPLADQKKINAQTEQVFQIIKNLVTAIRSWRKEKNIKPKEILKVQIASGDQFVSEQKEVIDYLSRVEVESVEELVEFDLGVAEMKVKIGVI